MTELDTAPDALPACNVPAERAVIGAMLASPGAVIRARLDLTAASFWTPWHGELFALICDLEDQGVRADPQTVVTTLAVGNRLGTDGTKTLSVAALWSECVDASNVAYHVKEVRTTARIRAIESEHARLGQRLDAARASGDHDALLTAVAEQTLALELLADEPDSDAPVDGLSTWDDFVTYQSGQQRWVVKDLIGAMDTVFLLSAPGSGKSFLSRLICTSLAAGMHPFTLEHIDPVRTLLVDLENSPGQVADETAPILGQVKRLAGGGLGDRGWVWMRPEGLNLRRQEDARLFEQVIAKTRPQVVAFGSLYNAYRRGSDGWDVAAGEVQDVLKRLRARHKLAFWIEHHMVRASGGAGHTGTPYGGTDWEKWPTHGRVLRKASDKGQVYLLERGTFRGDRGERPGIPLAVQRGGKVGLTAIYEEAELELILEALV